MVGYVNVGIVLRLPGRKAAHLAPQHGCYIILVCHQGGRLPRGEENRRSCWIWKTLDAHFEFKREFPRQSPPLNHPSSARHAPSTFTLCCINAAQYCRHQGPGTRLCPAVLQCCLAANITSRSFATPLLVWILRRLPSCLVGALSAWFSKLLDVASSASNGKSPYHPRPHLVVLWLMPR